jgi:hypothetical protein
MKRTSIIAVILALMIPVTGTRADNSADGALTVDGETTKLKYAYMSEFDGDIIIVLSNNPIAPEMVPDGVYSLGEQGKMRGLVFPLSRESRKLQAGGLYKLINAIHFHPKWNQLGSIGNGELKISQFTQDNLSATLVTPAENAMSGHKFTYKVSFSVSLKKPPLDLKVTGANDEPSRAYAAWGKALMAGDANGYRKYSSREVIEMLPTDPKELASGIDMQQSMFPTVINVVGSKITGDRAELALTGRRGDEVSEGTVTMLRENGEWKVNRQSWKSGTPAK